jgi:hypothetical protein
MAPPGSPAEDEVVEAAEEEVVEAAEDGSLDGSELLAYARGRGRGEGNYSAGEGVGAREGGSVVVSFARRRRTECSGSEGMLGYADY